MMSVVRHSKGGNSRRTFGFRGFYMKNKTIVDVHNCDFDSVEGFAFVSPKGSNDPLGIFRVKVKDLILLEDTSRVDMKGVQIYEGDKVRGMVENEFGSYQAMEGVVLFDEEKWGFSIEFNSSRMCDLTGYATDIEVIGSIFEDGKLSKKKVRTDA